MLIQLYEFEMVKNIRKCGVKKDLGRIYAVTIIIIKSFEVKVLCKSLS